MPVSICALSSTLKAHEIYVLYLRVSTSSIKQLQPTDLYLNTKVNKLTDWSVNKQIENIFTI